jgi:hypothetical protein
MDALGSTHGTENAPRVMRELSGPALAKLQTALSDARDSRDSKIPADVADAVRFVCDEAWREHCPPETLLIEFKRALETVGAVHRLPRGPERDEVIARLVTVCINEYYRVSPPRTFTAKLDGEE